MSDPTTEDLRRDREAMNFLRSISSQIGPGSGTASVDPGFLMKVANILPGVSVDPKEIDIPWSVRNADRMNAFLDELGKTDPDLAERVWRILDKGNSVEMQHLRDVTDLGRTVQGYARQAANVTAVPQAMASGALRGMTLGLSDYTGTGTIARQNQEKIDQAGPNKAIRIARTALGMASEMATSAAGPISLLSRGAGAAIPALRGFRGAQLATETIRGAATLGAHEALRTPQPGEPDPGRLVRGLEGAALGGILHPLGEAARQLYRLRGISPRLADGRKMARARLDLDDAARLEAALAAPRSGKVLDVPENLIQGAMGAGLSAVHGQTSPEEILGSALGFMVGNRLSPQRDIVAELRGRVATQAAEKYARERNAELEMMEIVEGLEAQTFPEAPPEVVDASVQLAAEKHHLAPAEGLLETLGSVSHETASRSMEELRREPLTMSAFLPDQGRAMPEAAPATPPVAPADLTPQAQFKKKNAALRKGSKAKAETKAPKAETKLEDPPQNGVIPETTPRPVTPDLEPVPAMQAVTPGQATNARTAKTAKMVRPERNERLVLKEAQDLLDVEASLAEMGVAPPPVTRPEPAEPGPSIATLLRPGSQMTAEATEALNGVAREYYRTKGIIDEGNVSRETLLEAKEQNRSARQSLDHSIELLTGGKSSLEEIEALPENHELVRGSPLFQIVKENRASHGTSGLGSSPQEIEAGVAKLDTVKIRMRTEKGTKTFRGLEGLSEWIRDRVDYEMSRGRQASLGAEGASELADFAESRMYAVLARKNSANPSGTPEELWKTVTDQLADDIHSRAGNMTKQSMSEKRARTTSIQELVDPEDPRLSGPVPDSSELESAPPAAIDSGRKMLAQKMRLSGLPEEVATEIENGNLTLAATLSMELSKRQLQASAEAEARRATDPAPVDEAGAPIVDTPDAQSKRRTSAIKKAANFFDASWEVIEQTQIPMFLKGLELDRNDLGKAAMVFKDILWREVLGPKASKSLSGESQLARGLSPRLIARQEYDHAKGAGAWDRMEQTLSIQQGNPELGKRSAAATKKQLERRVASRLHAAVSRMVSHWKVMVKAAKDGLNVASLEKIEEWVRKHSETLKALSGISIGMLGHHLGWFHTGDLQYLAMAAPGLMMPLNGRISGIFSGTHNTLKKLVSRGSARTREMMKFSAWAESLFGTSRETSRHDSIWLRGMKDIGAMRSYLNRSFAPTSAYADATMTHSGADMHTNHAKDGLSFREMFFDRLGIEKMTLAARELIGDSLDGFRKFSNTITDGKIQPLSEAERDRVSRPRWEALGGEAQAARAALDELVRYRDHWRGMIAELKGVKPEDWGVDEHFFHYDPTRKQQPVTYQEFKPGEKKVATMLQRHEVDPARMEESRAYTSDVLEAMPRWAGQISKYYRREIYRRQVEPMLYGKQVRVLGRYAEKRDGKLVFTDRKGLIDALRPFQGRTALQVDQYPRFPIQQRMTSREFKALKGEKAPRKYASVRPRLVKVENKHGKKVTKVELYSIENPTKDPVATVGLREFAAKATIRQDGLAQMNVPRLLTHVERLHKDLMGWALPEAHSAANEVVDGISTYFNQVGLSVTNTPTTMRNLLGGWFLNMKEGGLFWAHKGYRAFFAGVAGRNTEVLKILKDSGILADGSGLYSQIGDVNFSKPNRAVRRGLRAAGKLNMLGQTMTESLNRGAGYLSGYLRAMERIKKLGYSDAELAELKQKGVKPEDHEKTVAHWEGIDFLERTSALYMVSNRPNVLRSPMGRLVFHLNRFMLSYMGNFAGDVKRAAKGRPQALFRHAALSASIMAMGQAVGTNLGVIFGTAVEDALEDPLEMIGVHGGMGGLFPSLRGGDLPTGDSSSPFMEWIGDRLLPIPDRMGLAMPIQAGIDTASLFAKILLDDPTDRGAIAWHLKNAHDRVYDNIFPLWKAARRAAQAFQVDPIVYSESVEIPLLAGNRPYRTSPTSDPEKQVLVEKGQGGRTFMTSRDSLFRSLWSAGTDQKLIDTLHHIDRENTLWRREEGRKKRYLEDAKDAWDAYQRTGEVRYRDLAINLAYSKELPDSVFDKERKAPNPFSRGDVNYKVQAIYRARRKGLLSKGQLVEALVGLSGLGRLDASNVRLLRSMVVDAGLVRGN